MDVPGDDTGILQKNNPKTSGIDNAAPLFETCFSFIVLHKKKICRSRQFYCNRLHNSYICMLNNKTIAR